MRKFLSGILTISLPFLALSQDSTFHTEGFYYTNNNNAIVIISAAQQSDQKLLVSGNFVRYGGKTTSNLIRLLPNGTQDTTFPQNAGTDGYIFRMAVQTDGKILLQGNFTRYKDQPQNGLTRLLPNGDLDPTFTPYASIYKYNNASAMALQQDGKIIIAGFGLRNSGGVYKLSVIRLNTDGTLDNSFNATAGPDDTYAAINLNAIKTIAIQPDNKIVLGGSFTAWGGKPVSGVVRLDANGQEDPTFSLTGTGLGRTSSGGDATVYSIKALPDTSLLVGGIFSYYNTTLRPGFCRLKSNGELDSQFNSGGVLSAGLTRVESIAVLSDQKILVGGLLQYQGAIHPFMRFTSQGLPDNTGYRMDADASGGTTNGVQYLFPLADSSFYAIGVFKGVYNGYYVSQFHHILYSLQPDRSFTNTFQTRGLVRKTLVQPDGKIIAIGNFDNYGTDPTKIRQNVARLNNDGSLDESFTDVAVSFGVYDIARSPDGKTLLGGVFSLVGNYLTPGLARINDDGSVDPGLNTGWGGAVYSIYPDSPYVYVGGTFSQFNYQPTAKVARLLANGQVDNTFQLANTTIQNARALCVQTDGKLLVGDGGDVGNVPYNYNTPLSIYRFLPGGAPDAGFTPPQLGASRTYKVVQAKDSSIYWLGQLNRLSTPNFFEFPLIKLKPNGKLDNTTRPLPSDYRVTDFVELPDSNLIVCGQRLSNDSTSFILRLKPDLSIDSTFTPVVLYYNLTHVNLMPDGRILVAGESKRYLRLQQEQVNNIALLQNSSINIYADGTKVNNMIDTTAMKQAAVGHNVTETFTIKNSSAKEVQLLLEQIKFTGADASSFSVAVSELSNRVGKNDSLKLKVTFTPSSLGNKKATLILPYNNGLDNQYSLNLAAVAGSTTTGLPAAPANKEEPIVFPNPTSGSIQLKTPERLNHYQLFTPGGELIQQGFLSRSGGDGYTIKLASGFKGLLLLRLSSPARQLSAKVFVQ